MPTKLWIEDICQLLTPDINPIGVSTNEQINILTKLALVISTCNSCLKKSASSLKRTIVFISFLMFLHIILSANTLGTISEAPVTKLTSSGFKNVSPKEKFDEQLHNPVGNPVLKTAEVLSSPATGSPSGTLVESPSNPSRILGCSSNTDDWASEPVEDFSRSSAADSSLVLSPEIEAALTHNIPMDPSDEFYGANFSRQIYRIADDQGNYANSLYSQGPNQHCKQGSVFAHLGNPHTVYTKACTANNGYGQARRSGLHLPPMP